MEGTFMGDDRNGSGEYLKMAPGRPPVQEGMESPCIIIKCRQKAGQPWKKGAVQVRLDRMRGYGAETTCR